MPGIRSRIVATIAAVAVLSGLSAPVVGTASKA